MGWHPSDLPRYHSHVGFCGDQHGRLVGLAGCACRYVHPLGGPGQSHQRPHTTLSLDIKSCVFNFLQLRKYRGKTFHDHQDAVHFLYYVIGAT